MCEPCKLHRLDFTEYEEFNSTCLDESKCLMKYMKHKMIPLKEDDVIIFENEDNIKEKYLFRDDCLIDINKLQLSDLMKNNNIIMEMVRNKLR